MIELFLESYRLDIGKDEAALLTFAIDDITSFSSRNTSFSKAITLPGTARNNKAFGHIFELGRVNAYNPSIQNLGTNFNPAAEAPAKLFTNNLLNCKGSLKLLEVTEINGVYEYHVSIFGELAGLIQRLGGTKLEDLDFSAYNHVWNTTNIQASWNTINGSSYYYPLIDYGECSVAKHDWDIRAFRPAFYVKEYMDKIFSVAGYTYVSTFFSTSFFKSLIIPNNAKELYKINNQLVNGSRTTDKIYSTLLNTAVYIEFDAGTVNNFTKTSDYLFTYTGANPITVRIVTNIPVDYASDDDIYCTLEKNSGNLAVQYLPASNAGSGIISFDVTTSIVNGDTIFVEAAMGGGATYWDLTSLASSTINITSQQAVQGTANVGDTIIVNDIIPKGVRQVDFLSSIAKLFNLMIDDDKDNDKLINIIPYPDYYSASASDCVDWSFKMDRSKPKRIKPMSELNARYFEFKYKQDSDYYNDSYRKLYNEGYGDRVYDSGFEFAKNKETCEIIFAGSPLLGYSGEDKYITTCFKARNTSGAISEERTDTVIRILQAKKITGVSSYAIKDGASNLATGLTAYGYAGHLDDPTTPTTDLNFGSPKQLYYNLSNAYPSDNMFNIYWSAYMAEITDKDSKLLEAWFKLDTKDINALDFSKYVFVDGILYRLNKIVDWNANSPDVCKVTLIKVLNTTYV